MSNSKVGILFPSDEVLKIIDDTIRTKERSQLTYSLINSYGLMNFMKTVSFKMGKNRRFFVSGASIYRKFTGIFSG